MKAKKVKAKSNQRPPNFLLRGLRSETGKCILRSFGEEKAQSQIADDPTLSKQLVYYWTRKFFENGLIRITSDGKPKLYQLTAFGQKVLTRSEGDWTLPVVLEDYAVKYPLVKDHGLLDWKKLGAPRNWVKMGIEVGGCTVEKTSRSIIVHTGRLQGFDPHHLMFESGQIINAILDFITHNGVEIEPHGIPLHKPFFRFFSNEAERLNKMGTFVTKDGSIDHSPPERVSHVEFRGADTAKNYLEMPNRVQRIEQMLEKQSENLGVQLREAGKEIAVQLGQQMAADIASELRKIFTLPEANNKVDRYRS